MGKDTGFVEYTRETPGRRPAAERINDWFEVYRDFPEDKVRTQGARCMDCGVPFCHEGCPLGNLIPDWNDLVYRDKWRDALVQLHSTNNFPEFTGLICPAPCESACVLAINDDAVAIEQIELAIIERGFAEGWVVAEPPERRSGKTVGVVGAGPAGLAAAAELNRCGHAVTVYERDEGPGGLLRFGVPDAKLEKWIIDRRVDVLEKEGIEFQYNTDAGRDVTAEELQERFDAVVISIGSRVSRACHAPSWVSFRRLSSGWHSLAAGHSGSSETTGTRRSRPATKCEPSSSSSALCAPAISCWLWAARGPPMSLRPLSTPAASALAPT